MKPVDEEQELTRLLAQETSPLASSLGALRDHGPDAAELASLASRLALQGLDVSVPAPPAARPNPLKKWGWGGLGGVSAVLVWLALRGPTPVPHAALAVAPVVEVPTASAAVVERSAAVERGASVAGSRTVLGEGPSVGVEAPLATAAHAVAIASGAAPSPSVEAAKAATSSASPGGDVPGSANSPSNPSVVSTRAGAAPSVARAASSGAPAVAGAVPPPSELELLRDARLALRQSPARALELTDEHGRLYPQGKMTQERELIAVSALVALGRRTAALSRVASFERQFPTSPYRKQMGDLLR